MAAEVMLRTCVGGLSFIAADIGPAERFCPKCWWSHLQAIGHLSMVQLQ